MVWMSILDHGLATLNNAMAKAGIPSKEWQVERASARWGKESKCLVFVRFYDAEAALAFFKDRIEKKQGTSRHREVWGDFVKIIEKVILEKQVEKLTEVKDNNFVLCNTCKN